MNRCADEYLDECAGRPAIASGRRPLRWPSPQLVVPWVIAAVASLVAVAGWWPRLTEPGSLAVAGIAGQWGARMARESMLESGPRIGHWPWSGDAAAGSGDVVWDNERQQGFLLLRGFAANDPNVARYQLWIFDAARDERYPVDGGLFDVPPGQDVVVVPIRPAVRVSHPSAFAVTVEQPGGVVVSGREHVVALAHTDR